MRIVYSILGISILLSSCMGFGIKGEGERIEDTRFVEDFTGIKSKGSFDIIIRQGSEKEVRILAQKNILEVIETEVDGDMLEIDFAENVSYHNGVTVYVTNPTYKELIILGSGDLSSKGKIRSKKLDIAVAGSGDIDLYVEASSLEASIAGSGDMKLVGMADHLDLEIAGSGDADAHELESITCEISIAGSGSAEVFASSTLDVSIAGSGDITYKGEPKVESSIRGSGSITQVD